MPGRTTRFRASGGGGGGGGTTARLRWGPDFGNDEAHTFGPLADILVTEYRLGRQYDMAVIAALQFFVHSDMLYTLTAQEQLNIFFQLNALFPLSSNEIITLPAIQLANTSTVQAGMSDSVALAGGLNVVAAIRQTALKLVGQLVEAGTLSGAYSISGFLDQVQAGISNSNNLPSFPTSVQASMREAAIQLGLGLEVVGDAMMLTSQALSGLLGILVAAIAMSAVQLSYGLTEQTILAGSFGPAYADAVQAALTSPALNLVGGLQSSLTETGLLSIGSWLLSTLRAAIAQSALTLNGSLVTSSSLTMAGSTLVGQEFVAAAIRVVALALTGTLQAAASMSFSAFSLNGTLVEQTVLAGLYGLVYIEQIQAALTGPAVNLVGGLQAVLTVTEAFSIGSWSLSNAQASITEPAIAIGGLLLALSGALTSPAYALVGQEGVAGSLSSPSTALKGTLTEATTASGALVIGPPWSDSSTYGDLFGGSGFGSSYPGGAAWAGSSLWIPEARSQLLMPALSLNAAAPGVAGSQAGTMFGTSIFQTFSSNKVDGVGASATSLSVSAPSGLQVGDLMIAFASWGGSPSTITLPSGWAGPIETASPVGGQVLNTYWKIAAAGDIGASFTWSWLTGRVVDIHIARYSDVDQASPISVHTKTSSASAANPVCPTVTTTVDNCRVIFCFLQNYPTTPFSFTPPAGTPTVNERWDASFAGAVSGGSNIYEADMVQQAAGATGTKTFTSSNLIAAGYCAQTIALKPGTRSI